MRRLWVVAAVGAVAVAALFVGISQVHLAERCLLVLWQEEVFALAVDPVDLDFGLSPHDHARGYLERLQAQRLDVTASRPWMVIVSAGHSFWMRVANAGWGQPLDTTKPCTDLKLRTSSKASNGDFKPLLTEYTGVEYERRQDVAAGGGQSGFYRWDMDVRVDLDLTRDRDPGIYSLTYTYTLFPDY